MRALQIAKIVDDYNSVSEMAKECGFKLLITDKFRLFYDHEHQYWFDDHGELKSFLAGYKAAVTRLCKKEGE